jgi:hypothetical protein
MGMTQTQLDTHDWEIMQIQPVNSVPSKSFGQSNQSTHAQSELPFCFANVSFFITFCFKMLQDQSILELI